MSESQKGLYQKYIVNKANGNPLAEGFYAIVLRIDGGLYVDACRKGIYAFAEAVRWDNPKLADDLLLKIAELNPHKIKEVFAFRNGMVAVCDQDGEQIPEYQGRWDEKETIIRLIAPNAKYNIANSF